MSAVPKEKTKRVEVTPSVREVAAQHARVVIANLEASVRVLDDPNGDPRAAIVFVERLYHQLFQHEKARAWLVFAECVDAGARTSINSPAVTDAMRAKITRDYFRREYPVLDAKLDAAKVVAAVRAWRAQRNQWEAFHRAVLDFDGNATNPRNMSSAWRKYPHSPFPKRSQNAE